MYSPVPKGLTVTLFPVTSIVPHVPGRVRGATPLVVPRQWDMGIASDRKMIRTSTLYVFST